MKQSNFAFKSEYLSIEKIEHTLDAYGHTGVSIISNDGKCVEYEVDEINAFNVAFALGRQYQLGVLNVMVRKRIEEMEQALKELPKSQHERVKGNLSTCDWIQRYFSKP
jgi:hypothetical protein